MNKSDAALAYMQLKTTFDLKAKQRDALDKSPELQEILQLVHENKWTTVEVKMNENNYFES